MKIIKFETNIKRNLFLNKTEIKHTKPYTEKVENNVLNIYKDIKYQDILGFGGAFTGSTCYCLENTQETVRNNILDEYFGENGLNYSLCRLTIASSDFSPKSYSYSYKKDLSDFNISEDMKYIIPTIKMAQNRNPGLKFLATPWSPPAFMKNNKMLYLGGKLKDEFKQAWAEYLAKYFIEYKKLGIDIDYMTIQNEPNATQIWESCKFTAEEEADF